MSNIVTTSAFDPTAVGFGLLDKNRKGGKIVYMNYPSGTKNRLTIQTPAVAMPFGINPYTEDTTGEIQSYSVDISFKGHDTDPKIAEFMDKMRALDERLITTAVENSKEWFGKAMTRDLVSEFYRKLVKEPNNPQYAPTMKTKVSVMSGEVRGLFFDENRAPVTIDYLIKGCTVKMLLEIDRVWFVNKTFGVSWRLIQAAVVSRPRSFNNAYSFIEDPMAGDGDEPVTAEEF